MSPSSPATDLRPYRDKLEEINFKLFLCLDERKLVAGQIQTLKKGSGTYPNFDATREWELFTGMREQLGRLTLRELLGFSLIMEAHAGAEAGLYPSWSTGAHLEGKTEELHMQMNPLLLRAIEPVLFGQLPLKKEFKLLRDF